MRWLLLAVLALQAAMCGQKGPLYLPDQKQDSATPTIQDAPADGQAAATARRS